MEHCYKNNVTDVRHCADRIKLRNMSSALAGVVQWIECRPVNQRTAASIPSQGICLGCGQGPQ